MQFDQNEQDAGTATNEGEYLGRASAGDAENPEEERQRRAEEQRGEPQRAHVLRCKGSDSCAERYWEPVTYTHCKADAYTDQDADHGLNKAHPQPGFDAKRACSGYRDSQSPG